MEAPVKAPDAPPRRGTKKGPRGYHPHDGVHV